jgi:DmsE family decaheme c-type cytochrome
MRWNSGFYLPAAALAFVLALAVTSASVETAAPPAAAAPAMDQAPAATPPAGQPVPPSSTPAEYVGADTCAACHEGMDTKLATTTHGKVAHPRSPAAAQSCETCHGPGSRHVEDPSDPTTIRRFDEIAPREASATCQSCHTSSTHALWDGSSHDTRNMSCSTCHSVHDPKAVKAQLKAATETQLCASCHRVQANKVKRVSHMPLVEGKMECSSCHNPHGSTNVRLLKVGNWVNESCISCHTEKRGPFLFEHAAGRESCVSCHDPHGSSNDRMLVAKAPMLCQRCHIGTRHPSTIYDGLAVQNRSNRIIGRGCLNCHQQIHGSNHPSGQSLTR